MLRVAVTGGAGQIAYQLLFRIASGEVFGKTTPLTLHILEIEEALGVLEGVKMELEDCAFPYLREIHVGSDPLTLFKGVDFALLVGAKPRALGQERKDLLIENSQIFIEQGKALNAVASPDVKVFVVGNPCNTNCWIAMQHAPRIPRKNFFAMTRLDENRARSILAKKAKVTVKDVSPVTIWGNHSATQVPDFMNATILNQPIFEVISDRCWLEKDFIESVQKRGSAVIAARGKSSAASAAHALVEAICAILHPTPQGLWFSSGIVSDGNPYGIQENLIFSFPCRSNGKGDCEIVPGFQIDPDLREKLAQTEKELLAERQQVTCAKST